MPSYDPFLIVAFAAAYLAPRLITIRSGTWPTLALALVAGFILGVAAAWLLELAVTVVGRPPTSAGGNFVPPVLPTGSVIYLAALGSALGASFGDWIRRQRTAGIRSPLHAMAPVGLVIVLVLMPVVVVAALLANGWIRDRTLPEAPRPALADSDGRAFI